MLELQPNEHIIKTVRKHWFVFFLEVFFLGLAALVPFAIFPFAVSFFPILSVVQQSLLVLVFLAAGWLLIIWTVFFVIWTDYYLDVLIVTNQRIVDVEQRGLFAREVATSPLENVQDIKISVAGFIPTILDYGNLHVQTAGTAREIVVQGLRDPRGVKKVIIDAYHAHKNASRALPNQ